MPPPHDPSEEVNSHPVVPPGRGSRGGWSNGGVLIAIAVAGLVVGTAITVFLVLREQNEGIPSAPASAVDDRPAIKGDLEAVNQNGEKVLLSELRGKVWAVAQFFAICPICSQRNSTHLRSLAKRFADHPDFHLVCISIDPDSDDVEQLAGYAEAFGARVEKWWFLTGAREEIYRYLEDALLFPPVQERTSEAEAASLGLYLHDLGITVIDRQMRIVGKRDLVWAANQSSALGDEWEQHLYRIIEKELRRPAP